MIETLIKLAICGYGITIVLLAVRARSIPGLIMFGAASFCNILAILLNWIESGQPPLANMEQVMILLGACFFPAYLVCAARMPAGRSRLWFAVGATISLLISRVLARNESWHLPPVLQSPWFIPHVTAYIISYALAFLAWVITASGWISGIRGRNPDNRKYDDLSYSLLSVAFPLMTFGLFSGAIWADSAWGGYWSWDSKETWSLLTWILYLLYFHLRKMPEWQSRSGIAHSFAFLAMICTFFLVNLWPRLASLLHGYA